MSATTHDQTALDPTALRLKLLANGYVPVALEGKAPIYHRWQSITVTPDAIRDWRGANTGIRTGTLLGLDIDVPAAALAAEIEALADELLGPSVLVRIGQAPKSLRLYRRNAAARKRATPALYLPDGTKTQVEALGDGQQFAAFGIHPDTGRPYDWPDCSPLDGRVDAVPLVTEAAVAEFLADAEALLRAAGGRTKQEIDGAAKQERKGARTSGSGFFQRVNAAALADLDGWVPRLFPTAAKQPGTGAWRVSSADLGRDLQEDLSLHPDGIQDFGTERSMSPCDAVMEFGGAPTVQAAAFTLCEWMGREPAEFGWTSQTTGGAEFGEQAADGPTGPVTEGSVADAFVAAHREQLRFDHDRGSWFCWDGAHWKRDNTELAFNWAHGKAREAAADTPAIAVRLGKASFAAGVERLAKSNRAFAVNNEIWDRDPWLLGTPGGTVDLRTGKLRDALQANFITKLTAAAPAETAACPTWLAFLDQATQGDAALVAFLRRWCGYCLTGDIRHHALLFLYGPGGNGKGLLMNTIFEILGQYAKNAAMDSFVATRHAKHTTDIAMLAGARFVMTTEVDQGQRWDEAKVKSLTGGDPITARFLNKDNVTFTPQFKLMISGNHKPSLSGVDESVRRRFNIVRFLHKPAVPDPTLKDRLRAEGSGILRWMIDGCLAWQARGLDQPASVLAATADYLAEQDHFALWLDECCLLGPGLEATPAELLQNYQAWLRANGGMQATDNRVLKEQLEATPGIQYSRSATRRVVRGIGLRPVVSSDQWAGD